eukprot:8241327-Pyramimonas_sp.AAC.1
MLKRQIRNAHKEEEGEGGGERLAEPTAAMHDRSSPIDLPADAGGLASTRARGVRRPPPCAPGWP